MNSNRLHNIDYLRGLAASAIMVYHYITWSWGEFPSETLTRRIGIYGVSIFYVLSGLTLYHVYNRKLSLSLSSLLDFFKKRTLRIFPLLWLATLASILLSSQIPDTQKLLLNLTGLFGIVAWSEYYAIGVWSIGNELVFYFFFPFFVFMAKKSKLYLALFSILLFVIYLHFAFNILDTSKLLSEQWRDYVNPLNQVFLFLGGYLIGLSFEGKTFKTITSFTILAFGILLFFLYPASGDAVYLVTGVNRLVFTISCFLICLSFYKANFTLPNSVSNTLEVIGESSYSIYLLHPFIWSIVGAIFSVLLIDTSPIVKISICISGTFIASYIVYEKFEKYFMNLGRKQSKETS